MQERVDGRRVWYPVAAFFALAMGLGAGTVALAVKGVVPPELALAAALSASVAGLIMTAVEDGRAGLKLMLSRLLIWRVGVGQWLFALLFLIAAVLLGSLVNPLFRGDALSFRSFEPAFPIVPMLIIFFIVGGLGEELGWTGYLIPRLQARYSALTAGVIRAVLSGLWHVPLFLTSSVDHPSLASFPYSAWVAEKGFPVAFGAALLMFLLPWSILFGWMFNSTGGSLLLVSVLHGSEIWAAYWMLSAGIDTNNLDNYWGYGAVLVVTAVIVVVAAGAKDLSRKHGRIVYGSARGEGTPRGQDGRESV